MVYHSRLTAKPSLGSPSGDGCAMKRTAVARRGPPGRRVSFLRHGVPAPRRRIERPSGERRPACDAARRRGAARLRRRQRLPDRVPRGRGRPEPVGASGAGDLVQGHRRQRPLPHLRLPAAPGRAHRLVPRAALGRRGRPLQGLGPHQRPGLLHARHRRLPRQEPRRDLRLRLVPRRRRAASHSWASAAIAIRPATSRTRPRPPTRWRAGNARTPATWRSAPRPAPSGLRKFPNPRFDAERWRALNGGRLGTWEGYDRKLSDDKSRLDSRVSHLLDGSVEPPFLSGMACGACHIASIPLKPPKDPRTRSGKTSWARSATSTPLLRDHGLGHGDGQPGVADLHPCAARARWTPRPSPTTRCTTRAP